MRQNIDMHYAIWYIILAMLCIVLIAYTIWKKRDIKLLLLLLFMTGIASYFENIVFLYFQSYEYYPHIMEIPYYDNLLGAYISQYISVSSIAVFIAAFNLGYIWFVFFSAMFMGIEYAFLALGIYKVNWWHPSYTFVGLLIYFWFSKKWYTLFKDGIAGYLRLLTLAIMNYALSADIMVIPVILGHYNFAFNWFSDPARVTLAVIVIYMLIRGFMAALVCFYRMHWLIVALVPVLELISYTILIRHHIFTFKYPLDLYVLSGSSIVILFCSYYFSRVLPEGRK